MPGYLTFKESNCKNCYKCIHHCPVKAIEFSHNQARILEDECILCGQCCVNCPQGAKSVRNDLPDVKRLISEGHRVFASLAPSAAAAFPDIPFTYIRDVLLKLGFAGVEETAIGATVVKRRYEELISEGRQKIILSSCCHSVNTLIKKYYPDAVSALAKVVTPMMAHGMLLKQNDPQCKVVFVGPCISKKAEADEYPGVIDFVLTFEDISQWIAQECIVPERGCQEKSGKAGLFPIAGGIIDSMNVDENCGYSFMAVEGLDNCAAALEDVIAGGLDRCFIEMSACIGSCTGGPVIGTAKRSPIKDRQAVLHVAGREDFPVVQPEAEFLAQEICPAPLTIITPGSHAITNILKKMGKTLPEHELNCGSCGYDTCREKAAAVLAGKAEIAMCLPYLMARAESFSDTIIQNTPNGIIVLDRSLNIQQLNAAACRIMNIPEESSVLGRNVSCVLDPVPFAQVIADRKNIYDRSVYLAEYRKYIRMTIILDENYDIFIALMRDVTAEYAERLSKEELGQKAVEIADKVIEKQMRAVQEIASLLGETTAETKVALERLKETFL